MNFQPYTPSGQTPIMTPYNMTPHSSQTPRYGQTTPTQQQHGQFARPAPPNTSNRPPPNSSYRASPYAASPRGMPPGGRESRRITQDEEDWDKASNAWESHSRMKGSTPRNDMGRSTPRG